MDPTTTPNPTTDDKSCGCGCEACMAGNHDQCNSGTCSIKNAGSAPATPPSNPPA